MATTKYFCRTCCGLRKHTEVHTVKKSGSSDDDYINWMEKYSIITCQGCDTISFFSVYGDSEMYRQDRRGNVEYYEDNNIYPPYLEQGSELSHLHFIPVSIRRIYNETVSAIKASCWILAAGGLRAVIESTCNQLKIKKDNLAERINLLHEKGHISLGESKRLHAIRFLGNDALHEIEEPKKDQIFILLEIVNHLLANLFINDQRLKGKLEMIIDNYEDFLKLLKNKIKKDLIDKKLSLNQILEKSIRLIPEAKFKTFEKALADDVKSGNIDFLKPNPDSLKGYIIIKEPELGFDW